MQFILICILSGLYLFSDLHAESLSHLQDNSSIGLLEEAQEKNKYGQDRYAYAAADMSKESMIRFGHAIDCQASCPLGCCDQVDSLMGQSALYSLLGSSSSAQAKQHQISALGACESYNQISQEKQTCSKAVSQLAQFVPQPSWYTAAGDCRSDAPGECKFIEQFFVESPFKSKSVANNCGPKSDLPCGGIENYFQNMKLNSDGTMNFFFKGSYKKISLDDFSNSKKLQALGFSNSAIKDLKAVYSLQNEKIHKTIPIQVRKMHSIEALTQTAESKPSKPSAAEVKPEQQQVLAKPSGAREISSANEPGAMYKYLKEDPIGASRQNIFQMIHFRYQNNTHFLEKE